MYTKKPQLIRPCNINEEWRPVNDLNPHLSASSEGRVWSTMRYGKMLSDHAPGKRGYIATSWLTPNGRQGTRVHKIIATAFFGPPPKGVECDHINRDRADNRVCNLRYVSHSVNQRNRSLFKTSKTGIAGVHWYARITLWRAQIKSDNVLHQLGDYQCIIQASIARNQGEIKYWGGLKHELNVA